MPPKGSGPGEFVRVDRFEGGTGWIAHPEETMQRASHALVADGRVWIVDPVDAEGLDEALAELGEVAGVIVLYNYHRRDAGAVASRHDVPVSLPAGMSALDDDDLSARVQRVEGQLGDTGYYLHELANSRIWQEWALFDGETLVVPESVGAAEYFLAPGERLGVSMMRRLRPPAKLREFDPERVLCGHGEGVFADAGGELDRALDSARRTAPRMYLKHGPSLARNLVAAMW